MARARRGPLLAGPQRLLARTAVCVGRLHTATRYSIVNTNVDEKQWMTEAVSGFKPPLAASLRPVDANRLQRKPCAAGRRDHEKRCAGEYHRVGMGVPTRLDSRRYAGAAFFRPAEPGFRSKWFESTRSALAVTAAVVCWTAELDASSPVHTNTRGESASPPTMRDRRT